MINSHDQYFLREIEFANHCYLIIFECCFAVIRKEEGLRLRCLWDENQLGRIHRAKTYKYFFSSFNMIFFVLLSINSNRKQKFQKNSVSEIKSRFAEFISSLNWWSKKWIQVKTIRQWIVKYRYIPLQAISCLFGGLNSTISGSAILFSSNSFYFTGTLNSILTFFNWGSWFSSSSKFGSVNA
jgi:hypothetical protein